MIFQEKYFQRLEKINKERIIESIKKLNGTVALSMSVQSMDQEVLENIRRPNISVDKMLALAPTIREYGYSNNFRGNFRFTRRDL